MSRSEGGYKRVRTAVAPMRPTAMEKVSDETIRKPVLRGLSIVERGHVFLTDASGTRNYGGFERFSKDALKRLDAHLDYFDAANEGPDGSLPDLREAA